MSLLPADFGSPGSCSGLLSFLEKEQGLSLFWTQTGETTLLPRSSRPFRLFWKEESPNSILLTLGVRSRGHLRLQIRSFFEHPSFLLCHRSPLQHYEYLSGWSNEEALRLKDTPKTWISTALEGDTFQIHIPHEAAKKKDFCIAVEFLPDDTLASPSNAAEDSRLFSPDGFDDELACFGNEVEVRDFLPELDYGFEVVSPSPAVPEFLVIRPHPLFQGAGKPFWAFGWTSGLADEETGMDLKLDFYIAGYVQIVKARNEASPRLRGTWNINGEPLCLAFPDQDKPPKTVFAVEQEQSLHLSLPWEEAKNPRFRLLLRFMPRYSSDLWTLKKTGAVPSPLQGRPPLQERLRSLMEDPHAVAELQKVLRAPWDPPCVQPLPPQKKPSSSFTGLFPRHDPPARPKAFPFFRNVTFALSKNGDDGFFDAAFPKKPREPLFTLAFLKHWLDGLKTPPAAFHPPILTSIFFDSESAGLPFELEANLFLLGRDDDGNPSYLRNLWCLYGEPALSGLVGMKPPPVVTSLELWTTSPLEDALIDEARGKTLSFWVYGEFLGVFAFDPEKAYGLGPPRQAESVSSWIDGLEDFEDADRQENA